MGCLRRMRELGMGRPCAAREIEDARAVARCTGNTGAWNAAADEAIATSAAARMAYLVAAIRNPRSVTFSTQTSLNLNGCRGENAKVYKLTLLKLSAQTP